MLLVKHEQTGTHQSRSNLPGAASLKQMDEQKQNLSLLVQDQLPASSSVRLESLFSLGLEWWISTPLGVDDPFTEA